MNVLIITWTGDNQSVRKVTEHIESLGGRVYRFDTDLYPTEKMMFAKYINGKRTITLKSSEYEIDLAQIDVIWCRRIRVGGKLPKNLDQRLLWASVQEAQETLTGMLNSLDAYYMNPLHELQNKANKQFQLQLADTLGIEIPKTIITNDAGEVQQFYQEVNAPLITKMQYTHTFFDEGQEHSFYTNELQEEDIATLEGLEVCPMIFQEKIDKALELRVTIVGDQVFTAALNSQSFEHTKVDWRRNGEGTKANWQPYELPNVLTEKLLAFKNALGLNYGAADIILTPDGRYVFLEMNPAGEFHWIDLIFDGEVCRAMAELLMNKGQEHIHNNLLEISG